MAAAAAATCSGGASQSNDRSMESCEAVSWNCSMIQFAGSFILASSFCCAAREFSTCAAVATALSLELWKEEEDLRFEGCLTSGVANMDLATAGAGGEPKGTLGPPTLLLPGTVFGLAAGGKRPRLSHLYRQRGS